MSGIVCTACLSTLFPALFRTVISYSVPPINLLIILVVVVPICPLFCGAVLPFAASYWILMDKFCRVLMSALGGSLFVFGSASSSSSEKSLIGSVLEMSS